MRPVGQEPEQGEPQDHGRNPLQKEHPAPPGQVQPPVQAEQQPGQRRAHQPGHRRGGHEQGHGRGPPRPGKEIGQVQDHAREEPGLGQAEQEAQDVKLVGALGEGRLDAGWGIAGMLVGAGLYAEAYPLLKATVLTWGNYGPITIPQVLGVSHWVVIPVLAILFFALFLWIDMLEIRSEYKLLIQSTKKR